MTDRELVQFAGNAQSPCIVAGIQRAMLYAVGGDIGASGFCGMERWNGIVD